MPGKTVLDTTPAMWQEYRPFKERTGKSAPAPDSAGARRAAESVARVLKERFGARKVVLFGSLARGAFGQWSDIDLAVWGIRPAEFYRAVAFASGFSSAWRVDLVDAEDYSPGLREVILSEGTEL